jgi:hypothetical protein
VILEVLLHFEDHIDGSGDGEAVADDSDRLINWRQLAFGKLDVDGRAGDLNYVSDVLWHMSLAFAKQQLAISS